MLQEFTVDNFKSLINVTFRPHEQNLLLGVNNAGKTNLCQALHFLAATARMPLQGCAQAVLGGTHGITNDYFQKDTIEFQVRASVPFRAEELTFNYTQVLSVRPSLASLPTLEVDSETLRVRSKAFDDAVLVENTRERVRLLHETSFLPGQSHYVESSVPREATMLHRLYDVESNPRANLFKQYLAAWQFYALSPDAMRGFQHQLNQPILMVNGENLASVIHHLKTTDERRYRRILSKLQEIDRRIDVINFDIATEGAILMLFEDSRGNRLPVRSASSGTLRYLALLYIVCGQRLPAISPLIVVEEPENGIYVGHLRGLLETAEDTQPGPQLVFTSHSPYFIDLFDDRLDSIFLLKRGDQHSSLTQPDVEQVKKRLERFPLGEQHFREMLG
jgi:predicted ATPase